MQFEEKKCSHLIVNTTKVSHCGCCECLYSAVIWPTHTQMWQNLEIVSATHPVIKVVPSWDISHKTTNHTLIPVPRGTPSETAKSDFILWRRTNNKPLFPSIHRSLKSVQFVLWIPKTLFPIQVAMYQFDWLPYNKKKVDLSNRR